MIDKYYPEIGAACDELNQERIEDVKKQIDTLTDELKNAKPNPVLEKGCFPDYPYPWEFEENPPMHKTERRSGRYPWGEDMPEKTPEEWLKKIGEMKEAGLDDEEIRDRLDMSVIEYRTLMALALKERKERQKQSEMNFLTFNFRVKDLKSWDELFEFVKSVKLPFNNTVEISVQEYYRPFGPGYKEGCV